MVYYGNTGPIKERVQLYGQGRTFILQNTHVLICFWSDYDFAIG